MSKRHSNYDAPVRCSRFMSPHFRRGVSLVLLCLLASCTQKSRKSGVRDLQAGAPELKQLQLKYSFVFLGNSGKKYPIYMNAVLDVSDGQKEAVWNSNIDSDGGLVGASDESKTLKADKNLQMKSALTAASGSSTPQDPALLTFTSGNPELGRGMSVSLQKVVAGGAATWKAIALSYYGYDAQIEDSYLSAGQGAAASRP